MAEKNVLLIELYENLLTKDPNDYSGKVKITGTLRNAEIADRIVAERTEFRKETIVTILDMADQKKVEAIAEGKSLVDGVGQYLATVSGVFVGETDSFNPKKHSLRVSYTPGKLLQAALKNITANVRPGQVGPVINSITDSTTGLLNESLTPGGPAIITGSNILLKGEGDTIGVAFTSENGETQKVTLIVKNSISEIIFALPALEPGQYTLSVTTQAGTNYRLLKEPRTYQFPILLTVG